jgi:hypothetical protein
MIPATTSSKTTQLGKAFSVIGCLIDSFQAAHPTCPVIDDCQWCLDIGSARKVEEELKKNPEIIEAFGL